MFLFRKGARGKPRQLEPLTPQKRRPTMTSLNLLESLLFKKIESHSFLGISCGRTLASNTSKYLTRNKDNVHAKYYRKHTCER